MLVSVLKIRSNNTKTLTHTNSPRETWDKIEIEVRTTKMPFADLTHRVRPVMDSCLCCVFGIESILSFVCFLSDIFPSYSRAHKPAQASSLLAWTRIHSLPKKESERERGRQSQKFIRFDSIRIRFRFIDFTIRLQMCVDGARFPAVYKFEIFQSRAPLYVSFSLSKSSYANWNSIKIDWRRSKLH